MDISGKFEGTQTLQEHFLLYCAARSTVQKVYLWGGEAAANPDIKEILGKQTKRAILCVYLLLPGGSQPHSTPKSPHVWSGNATDIAYSDAWFVFDLPSVPAWAHVQVAVRHECALSCLRRDLRT